jgi:hypothetical protein
MKLGIMERDRRFPIGAVRRAINAVTGHSVLVSLALLRPRQATAGPLNCDPVWHSLSGRASRYVQWASQRKAPEAFF